MSADAAYTVNPILLLSKLMFISHSLLYYSIMLMFIYSTDKDL